MLSGIDSLEIRRFKKIHKGIILINNMETKIDEVWIYRDYPHYRNFLILKTNAMNPYLKSKTNSIYASGFYKGRYIDIDEYEDGFYRGIFGRIKELRGEGETRHRLREDQFWVLVPLGGNLYSYVNKDLVEEITARMNKNINLSKEDLDQLEINRIDPSLISTL
jgi:hypothetical protein